MAPWTPKSASPSAPAVRAGFGLSDVAAAIVREPAALAGLLMVASYALIALTVGFLPLRDPLQISAERLAAPTLDHPLGTDALGRDLLSRILFGARLSMRVTLLSVAAATAAGGALGLVSGYLGGWGRLPAGRGAEIFFCVPPDL